MRRTSAGCNVGGVEEEEDVVEEELQVGGEVAEFEEAPAHVETKEDAA